MSSDRRHTESAATEQEAQVHRGLTLRYTGGKATNFAEGTGLTGKEQLRLLFMNMGAFAMRVQLAQAQRAVLLQSATRENYCDDPVEKPSDGGNESALFTPRQEASPVRRSICQLEQYAHYPLGRSKILNDRAQPQKNRNTANLRGEQYLWDILHAPVWSTGLNLAGQLAAQGFIYICHPEGIDLDQYKKITDELQHGLFERIIDGDQYIIITKSGHKLRTNTFSALAISLDAEHRLTTQRNGFLVNSNGSTAPVGWTMHIGEKDTVLDQQCTVDLLRVIRIAQGGSHKLSREEFHLLLVQDNRGVTGEIRHTENRNLTLVDMMIEVLECHGQFNGAPLLGNAITLSYQRIQQRIKDTDVTESFLTGALQTEMVQPLKQTLPQSTRPAMPYEFRNTFDTLQNTNKAFAFAYDITRQSGELVFQAEAVPTSPPDSGLIDVRMHGKLLDPDLTDPRHVSALIATGVIVAEQIILEQLLRDAAQHGIGHPNAQALQKILHDDAMYARLVEMAKQVPSDEKGPILGLQLPASEPILEVLRRALGFDQLIHMANELFNADGHYNIEESKGNIAALRQLYEVGKIFQQLEGISVQAQGSRGLNAGIIPVIARIAPSLHSELVTRDGLTPEPNKHLAPMRIVTDEPRITTATSAAAAHDSAAHALPVAGTSSNDNRQCPFLSGTRSAVATAAAPSVCVPPAHPTPAAVSRHPWCYFFVRRVVPVAAASAVVAALSYAALS